MWETVFVTALITAILFTLASNLKPLGERIEHEIAPQGDLDSEQVRRSIGQLLGPPLVGGNKIQLLANGSEIFPSILEAIRGAKQSITFETFIYWTGKIGTELAEALSERAQNGVKVCVLLDWVGSKSLSPKAIDLMTAAGVEVVRYRPVKWHTLNRLNNRTHRKILVIDGKIGFTGGVGIADQWTGNANDENHWRDCHFKIEGPVVAQLQSAFLDNWNSTHPDLLDGPAFFPKLKEAGESCAQVFKSSPEEGSSSARLMFLYSIAHAERSIRIANAYFVPDSFLREQLYKAVARGVKVEVVVPGAYIDTKITRYASRANWNELLSKGVRIFEYQKTMFHCKYMIVDGIWSSVGSTNFDNRSLRLNDECNLNAIDRDFAAKLELEFARDKSHAKEITLESFTRRGLLDRSLEFACSTIRSQV